VLNFGKSGGNRVLSKLADELIYLGHTVDFLSSGMSDPPYFPTKAGIRWVDDSGAIKNKRSKNRTTKDSFFSIQGKLTKALKRFPSDSYDLIIANQSLTTLPIKEAKLLHKTVYYVQAYEPDLYYLMGGIKNRLLAYLSAKSYRMNLFTIVNAEPYFSYKKLKSSRVLYPGIDFNYFYPKVENRCSKDNKKIIIGTIGRPELFKGTRYVVEAFEKLKKKYPFIELHLAFTDPNDFKNCDRIFCFKPDGDEELGKFYRSLDYYICAGYVQLGTFHYPVVEAMSCGISVITTSYYPADETNAWITIPQSADEIVKHFELAQKTPGLREKKIKQALSDVRQFEWRQVGKKLNNYLQEFLNSKQ
jgi:glycosyltransferase involved in cell wall biosynthesis